MVNGVRFVISKEDDLASGPGTRLDHSELLCDRSFITLKKDRESFWSRYQNREGECPIKSYQGLKYFYQTHSHNIHLKLTRLELTIERSYQESLRRNEVAIMINKTVRNAVLGCNLKNDRIISVHFQGKSFSITVIQVYAPTSNAEEAEIERFCEDL